MPGRHAGLRECDWSEQSGEQREQTHQHCVHRGSMPDLGPSMVMSSTGAELLDKVHRGRPICIEAHFGVPVLSEVASTKFCGTSRDDMHDSPLRLDPLIKMFMPLKDHADAVCVAVEHKESSAALAQRAVPRA